MTLGAPAPMPVTVAAMLTAPSPPAATGQEAGEERVELSKPFRRNVDRDLRVLRGSWF
jgi:hypothetical protein